MKWEFSCYTTPSTIELLPFITINKVVYNDDYAYCIMFGWLQLVFDLQISNK